MKSFIKIVCMILSAALVFLLSACMTVAPQDCERHLGEGECRKCGLNYFEELARTVREKATEVEDGAYRVTARTETVDCIIKYDPAADSVQVFLIYKDAEQVLAVFLLTMKPNTGSLYGWALSAGDKIANGTFDAKNVAGVVFCPEVTNNTFTDSEFAALEMLYEESVSFCADVLDSLLVNNENNLTIADLGFENYAPAV